MKRKKVRRAPSWLRRKYKGDSNLAFYDSPYYKYVIAGTAVILAIFYLVGIVYLQSRGETQVLGTHASAK